MKDVFKQDLVKIVDNKSVADSIMIGLVFEKEHKHVLRDIRNLVKKDECSISPMFIETFYNDSCNRKTKKYLMTRDGFSLLVMGFTGNSYIQFKLLYLEQFNKMEEELRNQLMPKLPITYKEALLALVKIEEDREQLEFQNALDDLGL